MERRGGPAEARLVGQRGGLCPNNARRRDDRRAAAVRLSAKRTVRQYVGAVEDSEGQRRLSGWFRAVVWRRTQGVRRVCGEQRFSQFPSSRITVKFQVEFCKKCCHGDARKKYLKMLLC
eukprot:gene9865-biopygen16754